MNPDTLLACTSYTRPQTDVPPDAILHSFLAGSYELPATFAAVMLLSALVLVVFMRPGTTARIVTGVPFSLFILATAAIPIQAATGFLLLDFSLSEPPSPAHSTLRLAAELICFYAAWKSVPWLYVGKEKLIEAAVRALTGRKDRP